MSNKHHKSRNLIFMIDATERCNFQCRYCYFGEKGKRKMNVQKVFKSVCNSFMSIVTNCQVDGVELYYMGGEPLLAWQEILRLNELFKVFAEQNQIKFRWGMTSNISLLDEKKADFMIANNANVHISIDGSPDIHNKNRPLVNGLPSYEIVKKKIPLALKITPNDVARVTVCPEDADRLVDIADHLFDLGFNEVGLYPAYNMGWDDRSIGIWSENILLATAKSKIIDGGDYALRTIFTKDRILSKPANAFTYCGAGKSLFGINVDGLLFHCHHFTNTPENIICDAANSSVEEISIALKKSTLPPRNSELPEQCIQCPARGACNGGCWADNYLNNLNAQIPEDIACRIRYATFQSLQGLYIGDRVASDEELQVIKNCSNCYECQSCYHCDGGGCQYSCDECQKCVTCQSSCQISCQSCEECDNCQRSCELDCQRCDAPCVSGCDYCQTCESNCTMM